MRNLDQNTGAIPRISLTAASTAVAQIQKDGQCLIYDFVGFFAFDIDHKSNAAGIMLKGGIVKALSTFPVIARTANGWTGRSNLGDCRAPSGLAMTDNGFRFVCNDGFVTEIDRCH